MSVVFDAVNSFFGASPSHSHYAFSDTRRARNTSTPAQPRRSATITSSDTPMSASEQSRNSSSNGTTVVQTPQFQDHASAQHIQPSQQSTQDTSRRPSSPPLAARDAPPADPPPSLQESGGVDDGQEILPSSRRRKVKVRDLDHIQSFANEDMGAFSEIRNRSRSSSCAKDGEGLDDRPLYEISDMKVEHIIEMVAGLLTKITTTNDQQHEHLHRQPPLLEHASHLDSQTNSVLAFHGKNVPSITILSYLGRIHKYCPTSYEVFLSLLVYFDRMTERVNAGPMQSLREANDHAWEHNRSASSSSSESASSEMMEDIMATTPQGTQTATPPSSGSFEKAEQQGMPGTPHSRSYAAESPPLAPGQPNSDAYNLSRFFVVDSFNIHRLVIAGVTCASKFFSDVFYTNSRYAKVGGLPLSELNHLELQFLLLNDFRLSIPVEELEAYGTMLVEFYAREVVAQRRAAEADYMHMQTRSLSESSSDSTATVRASG